MYNVELLSRAIEEVCRAEEEPERFITPVSDYRPTFRVEPKGAGRRVAEQVLILSGVDPHAATDRIIPGHLVSVEERAAALLGLEDHSIIFDDEVSLSAIGRYRDQMADGDEPDGLDFDDLNLYENERYYDLV